MSFTLSKVSDPPDQSSSAGVRAEGRRSFPWRLRLTRSVILPCFRKYSASSRAQVVLEDFSDFLQGTILDVGSGNTSWIFRERLGLSYSSSDIASSYKTLGAPSVQENSPDIVVDLENSPPPFSDRGFTTVMCLDTLEHIDRIHQLYDELFRVAERFSIVSLPNNWPGMIGSFLVGHNRSHQAGYGLTPEPKWWGRRHKHFFNLEEACDFLLGRMPDEFSVRKIEFYFEHGNDGLLFIPPFSGFFRKIKGWKYQNACLKFGNSLGFLIWVPVRVLYGLCRTLDAILSALIWGWGDKVRFYNLFCRQIWVVFERKSFFDPVRAQ